MKPPTGKLAVCGEVFIPAVPAAVYQTFSHCRRLRKDTWMGIERDDLWFSRRGIIMTFHWDFTHLGSESALSQDKHTDLRV